MRLAGDNSRGAGAAGSDHHRRAGQGAHRGGGCAAGLNQGVLLPCAVHYSARAQMTYARGFMAVHTDESCVVWKAVQLCKPTSLESYCYCSCPACPPTRPQPLCWQSLCPSCCRRHPPQRQRLLLRFPLLLPFLRQVRHIRSWLHSLLVTCNVSEAVFPCMHTTLTHAPST